MNKTYPTLYKKTSTGKIQVWFVEQNSNKYRTTSGQLDGKKVTSEWTVAQPKNIGKNNATTGEQQAIAEIEAMYVKQRKKDYRDNVDQVDTITRFKPMLAEKWADCKDNIKDQIVFIQAKLDGIRCIAKADGLWTRNGEPIIGAPHIFEQIKHIFVDKPDLILDGELYNHDLKNDFNKIVSCVKKQKPTKEDLEVSARNIQYWVYDTYSKANFEDRYKIVSDIVDKLNLKDIVKVVASKIDCKNVDSVAEAFVESGFEGAMIRLRGSYENKRSKTLLKWKEFQDSEFEIVDIREGDGNRSGMAARVILKLDENSTFAAGVLGNVPYCIDLLKNKDKYIGTQGTVIFQNYTPDGVPRFPKFKTVRNYE